MKNILCCIILLHAVSISSNAQYIPNNAQSFQFMPLFNPAFAGIEHFNDLKFSYRYQWSGFGESAPKFINVAYHTRVVEPLDLAYNSLRLSDPSAANPVNLPRAKRMIHGLGGNIFHSEIGVLKSAGANVNYAIHYPVGEKSRLSVGAAVVVENRQLDIGEVTVRDPDDFYNHLLASSTAQTDLNVRAGILLYAPNYYVGISYLPVVYKALQASELAMTQPFYRGTLQAGVSLTLNPDVILKPGILALIQMNDRINVDYQVKAYFRQQVWLGMTYRDIQSGVAIIGWNFNERLSASYAYEMSLGAFKQFNDGSHELVLGVRINNFRKYPQYTW